VTYQRKKGESFPWAADRTYTVDECIGYYERTSSYRYKMEESVGSLQNFVMSERYMVLYCVQPKRYIKEHKI
jgi:hypothetical protein